MSVRPFEPAVRGEAAAAGEGPSPPIRPPAPWVRALAALALWAAVASTLAATGGLAALGTGLRSSWGAAYFPVLALAVVSGALTLRAALGATLGVGAGLRAAHLRLWLGIHVLAAAVHVAWLQPFHLPLALATAALAGGAFGLASLLLSRRRRPAGRLGRGADVLLTSIAIAALGLELGLRLLVEVRPSPLLVGGGADARSFLRAWRAQPGELHFRFLVNERGDWDHPWHGRRPGERLVVSIADSFSRNPVPHPLHFTSVAERELERTEVYNMGAPAIGPPEYLYLLEEEALAMLPDLVVVNLFVGNDLIFRMPGPRDVPWLRALLDADEVVLARLVRRVRALSAARARQGGGPIGVPQGARGGQEVVTTVEEAYEAFPYTVDLSLERPTHSVEEFLRIETTRAHSVCRVDAPPFSALERVLGRMVEVSGRVPFALVLIPDEFQVEEDLWRAVVEANPRLTLQRDRPQRILRAWCEANDVPVLDLLPIFLEVPPLEDGRRHLYHLRDTHWNARGNQVAGEALAEFVREQLGP